jgi:hypothetical protein
LQQSFAASLSRPSPIAFLPFPRPSLILHLSGPYAAFSCRYCAYYSINQHCYSGQLSYLVTALDRVFDRCEDTVRHTDVSIRCLLRSSYPDRTYKAPFELVSRKATTEGYRRLFKKAVCYCVRFWRLNPAARQKLRQRSLTDAQDQSLRELWCDDAWAAMPRVQETEPHRREPSPEAVSPVDDDAWLSEDCFEDMGSTYTDNCLQTRNTQKRRTSSSVDHRTPKRHRTAHSPENKNRPPLQDEHTLPKCKENKASDGPWATDTEAAIYKTAPKVLWPGSLPILGRPTPLEREDVIKERKMISMHISHVEAQLNRSFQSRRRLLAIDQAFVRWRNVGCQLCYASTGEYEPDHDLEQCSRPESSEKARKIFTWLQRCSMLRR